MSERTPNHVCKACGKAYYACPDCDRVNSWKSMACSPSCYQKYMQMVLEARRPVVLQGHESNPVEETVEDSPIPSKTPAESIGEHKSTRKKNT